MKKRSKLSIFIFLFIGISVLFPLINMLLQIDFSNGNFQKLVASTAFKNALSHSLFVTSIGTILSVCIAFFLAYALNRTNIKHRSILKVLISLPMLIPSISHGLGLINLFGVNGIITQYIPFNIIGRVGIIMGSIIYSFPIAFLILDDGFYYIDNNLYSTAKVLGMNKWQTFKKVTFCYLKKPLLSAFFAVFTMIFTDYGVPLAVGGKYLTLPVFLYKEVIGLLDYSEGTMIGLFLLIPAFISFVFDTFFKNYGNVDNNHPFKREENKGRDILVSIGVYIILGFVIVLLGSFIYYAFVENVTLDKSFSLTHFNYVVGNNIGSYIFNSIFIALIVSLLGTIVGYSSAYVTARVKGKLSKFLHMFIICTLAIPGIVLGLSYTISFHNTFIYNTYVILIMVNIVHFIATPYLMAYNALLKVNQNYEIVAKTCNISTFRIVKDVIIPCTKNTIREMLVYLFVNSMVTISAVTFLFNSKTMPLSLLINNYEGNMMLGEAAIVSLLILIINVLAKVSVYILNYREERKKENYGIIEEAI